MSNVQVWVMGSVCVRALVSDEDEDERRAHIPRREDRDMRREDRNLNRA